MNSEYALTIVENKRNGEKNFLLSKFDEQGKIVFKNTSKEEVKEKLKNPSPHLWDINDIGEFIVTRIIEVIQQPLQCLRLNI